MIPIYAGMYVRELSVSASGAQARDEARELYRHAYTQGRLKKIWTALRGASRDLRSLPEDAIQVSPYCSSGQKLQAVLLDQIQGTGRPSRRREFDIDFWPLQARPKPDWLKLATAWLRGASLQAVSLVQIGDIYFVQDGHSRISVARALGHKWIEAEVSIWQVKVVSNGPEVVWGRPPAQPQAQACPGG
jgi:hypothetical protein